MPAPRVLVTRSPHQGSALADHLRALGAEPILIPTIETVDPGSFAPLDIALAALESFHWLLFTSANAVEAFARRQGSRNLPAGLKIAAIGPATARVLEKGGLKVDLLPAQAVAESLTGALLPYAQQPDGTPTRFLLIRAQEAREHLPDSLRSAGAEVTVAPGYRTILPQGSAAVLRDLFRTDVPQRLIDAITFTSSSAARNLLTLCEAGDVTLPETALRLSIGSITSQTLRDLGLPPHAEAPEPTVASLAETVLQALAHR